MAIGNSSYKKSNSEGGIYEKSYIPRMRLTSADRSLDAQYWKGMLKLGLTQITNNNGSFTYTNSTYIFLTFAKAYVLKSILEEALAGTLDGTKAVASGAGEEQNVIIISTIKKDGNNILKVGIGKIDANGKYLEYDEIVYEPYMTYIQGKDLSKDPTKFENGHVKDFEITSLILLLDQFIKGATGGIAYSVHDINRYYDNSTYNSINDIKQKLGISTKGSNSNSFYNKSSNKSAFSNNFEEFDEDDE